MPADRLNGPVESMTFPVAASEPKLAFSNAVAAIIVLEDGHYLLQHRDNNKGIWFPNHWGCFGGAVDEGEDPYTALCRELHEELEFNPNDVRLFTRFDFDLSGLGMATYYRAYYVVSMSHEQHRRLVLHEGQAVASFHGETMLNELRVSPYDAFALYLHYERKRLGNDPAT